MHKRIFSKISCTILSASFLLSLFCVPITAAENTTTRRTIRVGLRNKEIVSSNASENSGVLFDKQYLQAVAEYANWDYTYVYDTWEECQQRAKDGEVDVLLDVTKTEERSTYLDYSDDAMGNEICYLVGREDTTLYYNDYAGFDGLKIGYEAGSTMIDSLDAYSKEVGFSYQPVKYDSGVEMFTALDDGEIDALVQTNYLEVPDGHVILAKCSSLPVYIATTKRIPELKQELDHAMTQLISYEPNFNTIVYQKVFNGNSAMNAGFTKEETAYLNTNPTVYVEYETDWKPFEYEDKNGAAGITPDVIRAIGKQTGINFQFINAASTKEIYQTMGNTSADLVMAVSYDYLWANDHDLLVTQPYVSGSIMRVTKDSNDSPKTAAVAQGGYLSSQIKRAYPDFTYLSFDTFDQCIQAVAEGKADCTFLNYYQANYYRALSSYSSFTYRPVDTVTQSIALGVTKESNPLLLDILSKSLQHIQDNELQSILSADTVINEPASLRSFAKHYPVTTSFIVTAFMILLAIVLLMTIDSKNRKRRSQALAQAKKEAEDANKAKSEFLANMSHDIRTPLNAIVGMTNMAISSIDDQKQALEDMKIVTAASKHLLSLVNDVLDLSKIESGQILLAQNRFSLAELIVEVERISWPLSNVKNQEFRVSADHVTNEYLFGDKERLKQILVNFLSNATKYTPQDGKIHLAFEEIPTDDPKVILLQMACSDTGIGIAKEHQKEIFEPFNREISSTVNPIEGTGLGLTIVKRIVTAMNGTIALVSEKGKGSTFTVKIPLKTDDDNAILSQYTEVANYQLLCIADDEELRAKMQEMYLRGHSTPCDIYLTEQVLQNNAVLADHYDAILILSEEHAGDVIRKLRQKYPEAGILYGSLMKGLPHEKEILDAGADTVVYRPIFRSSLYEAYREFKMRRTVLSGNDQYLTNMHVLVAEDQPVNYAVAEYLLKAAGATVQKAVNGKEAVDAFLASSPGEISIIFMDIMMPVMNGYDAAKLIRASNRSDAKSVIIVAMTANAFSEDVQRSFEAGMDGHLSKPIESAVIKDTLLHIFTNKSGTNK